ncbi:12205_t:CDS:10, partial [Ambispora leptoticha]
SHRDHCKDVGIFWDRIEENLIDTAIKAKGKELRLTEIGVACSVMNSTSTVLQTAIRRVDTTLKSIGKRSSESMIDNDTTGSASIKKVKNTGPSASGDNKSQDLDEHDTSLIEAIEANSEGSVEDEPKDTYNTPSPCHFSLISSESESDEDYKSDKENDSFFKDINTISFDDYLNQNKTESEWRLRDGRLIVEVLNTKTAEVVKLVSEKEQTQFMKSVIRLGLSSIIDLSSEFKDGMYTWFGQEWIDIKRKVYGIVNMEPNIFEVEITNVIDTVEEENKTGKYQELSEIEYAMTMTAPVMNNIFSDVLDYLKLRWGETLSSATSDRRRKIDLRIVHKVKKLELGHSECAKAPTPAKAVHDRSKCLRTLKGVLDNFLKEDLSDEEVQDSKILGIQFSGVDLLEDGLYFGLEGSTFNFPAQLTNIKCLRGALETLYFFKQNFVKKAKLIPDPKTLITHIIRYFIQVLYQKQNISRLSLSEKRILLQEKKEIVVLKSPLDEKLYKGSNEITLTVSIYVIFDKSCTDNDAM